MSTMLKSRVRCLPVVAALLLSAACAEPTLPTPEFPPASLDVYSGTLQPGGSNQYLFSLQSSSSVQLMLAGVIATNPLRSLSPTLRLEIASWDGSGCAPNREIDTAPILTARLQAYLIPGTYCARVSDIGELTGPVNVTLRVVAPALASIQGEPGSRVFGSTITPGGSAATSIVASRKGRVTVSLDEVSANTEMAVALGIPAPDGSGCRYARVVTTTPGGGPHIDETVDPGPYCAAIIDVGNLADQGTFSMTVTHP